MQIPLLNNIVNLCNMLFTAALFLSLLSVFGADTIDHNIINAENYKLSKILIKHPELGPIFQDIIKKSKCSLILLFGSYAKNSEKKESDIDIYLETTNQKTKEEVQKIYDLLSVKLGKFNPEDLLIKEIIKNHAIIKGGEEYYEKIKLFE